jgi:RNA recognition motif-containing protein
VPGGGRVEGKGGNQKGKRDSKPRADKDDTPTVVETPRLYVGNLSYDATEYDLEELFKGIGSVRNVELVYNRHTHKSKGYGFISMANVDEAKRAVEVLHDQPFMGRKMIVNGARSKGPADGDGGGEDGNSRGGNRSRNNSGGGNGGGNRKSADRQDRPARNTGSDTPIPEEEEVHSLAPDKD